VGLWPCVAALCLLTTTCSVPRASSRPAVCPVPPLECGLQLSGSVPSCLVPFVLCLLSCAFCLVPRALCLLSCAFWLLVPFVLCLLSCAFSSCAFCLVPLCLVPSVCAFCLVPSVLCLLSCAFCLVPSVLCLLSCASCLMPSVLCLVPYAFCLVPRALCLLSCASCLVPPVFCLEKSAGHRGSLGEAEGCRWMGTSCNGQGHSAGTTARVSFWPVGGLGEGCRWRLARLRRWSRCWRAGRGRGA